MFKDENVGVLLIRCHGFIMKLKGEVCPGTEVSVRVPRYRLQP